MAIVIRGLACPSIVSVTGTFAPVGVPDGTTAFTWYNPAKPGVKPEKFTCADWPPIANWGGATVFDNCWPGAAPSPTPGFTAPRPVQYRTIVSPACAGAFWLTKYAGPPAIGYT